MSKLLQDKIALVTGGGQGLGQAICLRLAAEGCDVAVADLNSQAAAETAALVARQTGRQTLAITVDVTNEAQVEAMVAQTLAKFGRLDIAVSNAGILIDGEITEFPAEKWRAEMNVILVDYFLVAKHVAAPM